MWENLVCPDSREFFRACAWACRESANANPKQLSVLDEWIGADSLDRLLNHLGRDGEARRRQLRPRFLAHLLCACYAAAHWPSGNAVGPDTIRTIADHTGECPGLIHALLEAFAAEVSPVATGDASRRVTSSFHWSRPLRVEVLVVLDRPEKGENSPERFDGLSAGLEIQTVSPGSGRIFPAPDHALVYCNEEFTKSFEDGRDHVTEKLRAPRDRDICWRLVRRERGLPAELRGPSASGAFGLALACILAGEGE
jgi:hypothetical protein